MPCLKDKVFPGKVLVFALIWFAVMVPMLTCASSLAQQKNDEKVWLVVFQIGFAGRCKGYIAKDKLCFSNGLTRFLFVAPNYDDLYLVSDEAKVYWKQNFDKWLLRHPIMRWTPWTTVPTKSTVFERVRWQTPPALECESYECKRVQGEGRAYLAATRTIPANDGVRKACCKMCGAPLDKGLPIVFMPQLDLDSSKLFTAKAEKVSPPKGVFEIPKNYREAKDEADLYVGGDMDTFFQGRTKK